MNTDMILSVNIMDYKLYIDNKQDKEVNLKFT